jgi:glycosyltransferase involved in cell wall biosynthesis
MPHSHRPRVSVLMPVFNAQLYLSEAVASILAQTFGDFELVIVDDGSADASRRILAEHASRDSRIKLLLNENNVGIADTLNRGLAECRGEYVARMDSDDVSLPQRLAHQVAFMDANPHVGASGTWFDRFGHVSGVTRTPQDDESIKLHHLFSYSAIGHPTAIVRKALLDESGIGYRTEEFPAEDLWFWIRLGFRTKLANLPQPLLRYRVHPGQITESRRALQNRKCSEAQVFYAGAIFGRPLSASETRAHRALAGSTQVADASDMALVVGYAKALLEANAATMLAPHTQLEQALEKRVRNCLTHYAGLRYKDADRYTMRLLVRFIFDGLMPFRGLGPVETLRFAAKCLLRHVPRRSVDR